jgi:hypothetical protein
MLPPTLQHQADRDERLQPLLRHQAEKGGMLKSIPGQTGNQTSLAMMVVLQASAAVRQSVLRH